MNNVINKWKLNKSLLAQKMNMPLGTFCNKLNPKHKSIFTDTETVQLKMILKEIVEDVSGAIEIDFNDALKVIVNKSKK